MTPQLRVPLSHTAVEEELLHKKNYSVFPRRWSDCREVYTNKETKQTSNGVNAALCFFPFFFIYFFPLFLLKHTFLIPKNVGKGIHHKFCFGSRQGLWKTFSILILHLLYQIKITNIFWHIKETVFQKSSVI